MEYLIVGGPRDGEVVDLHSYQEPVQLTNFEIRDTFEEMSVWYTVDLYYKQLSIINGKEVRFLQHSSLTLENALRRLLR
jgi:hypothetical protein